MKSKPTPGMSRPKDQTALREHDFFPTHPDWTRALLRVVQFDGPVSEPCAGDGAIVRVLEEAGYSVDGSDIRDHGAGFRVQDAFSIDCHTNVVTNPPYRWGEDLIQHWLRTTRAKVAVLMRMQILEGTNRFQRLFTPHPPAMLVVIPERMPVHNLVCQFPHVWIVWDNQSQIGETKLVWSSAREVSTLPEECWESEATPRRYQVLDAERRAGSS